MFSDLKEIEMNETIDEMTNITPSSGILGKIKEAVRSVSLPVSKQTVKDVAPLIGLSIGTGVMLGVASAFGNDEDPDVEEESE